MFDITRSGASRNANKTGRSSLSDFFITEGVFTLTNRTALICVAMIRASLSSPFESISRQRAIQRQFGLSRKIYIFQMDYQRDTNLSYDIVENFIGSMSARISMRRLTSASRLKTLL
jgi:hypothetical protein